MEQAAEAVEEAFLPEEFSLAKAPISPSGTCFAIHQFVGAGVEVEMDFDILIGFALKPTLAR